jgi:cytochrome c
MFILEKKYKLFFVISLATILFTGCMRESSKSNSSVMVSDLVSTGLATYTNGARVVDGGFTYPIKNGKTTAYNVNEDTYNGGYSYGRTPTKEEEKAWNTDIMPDGTGLPEGSGSVESGDEIFENRCASCHGDFGIGNGGYPKLQGGKGTLTNQLLKPEDGDEAPIKTIGSYWPYASTLYWYIQSAMPYPHPKSLSNNEIYALVAYIMSINEIKIDGVELDDDYILDREKLLKIKLPNENGFYPEVNGDIGAKEVTKFLGNPENYGTGKRCMSGCKTYPPIRIGIPLENFDPKPDTNRNLPKQKGKSTISEGQTLYEQNCAVCHSSTVMGAPVIKDKNAWGSILEKGINNVYKNAIHGINGMPPRGGTTLSDDKMKIITDYIIKVSK